MDIKQKRFAAVICFRRQSDISIDEAQELLNAYYEENPKADTEDRTEEADKVAVRIAKILSEKAFSFTPNEYISIHKKLFLRNLLLDEKNELHNCSMHISGMFEKANIEDIEADIETQKADKEESNMLFIHYPKCTTCQKAKKWLDEHNAAYTERHIVDNNLTYEELKEWYEKSGLPLKKFFNTSGMLYREMQLKDKLAEMSDEEQLNLLASNGMLVKRPLIVTEDKVLIGFKEAEWSEKI